MIHCSSLSLHPTQNKSPIPPPKLQKICVPNQVVYKKEESMRFQETKKAREIELTGFLIFDMTLFYIPAFCMVWVNRFSISVRSASSPKVPETLMISDAIAIARSFSSPTLPANLLGSEM